MIPIAGSAYTYTYATLGELIAWIIGWDLILEYAFSNMSVSVGFAAHVVALLDWMGLPLSPKWLSPAYLPLGLQDLQGKDIYAAGWHAGFNIPAFLIVLAADGRAGARHSRVGANQQHHGAGEDRGDPAVRLLRAQLYSSGELHALLAQWMVGRAGGRVDHLLHLYRLRFGLDGERGVQAAQTRCADRDSRDADGLHDSVHRCGGGADGDGALAVGGGRCGAGGQCAEAGGLDARRTQTALGAAGGADWRARRDDLVDPGVSAGPGAGLVCHVARPAAAGCLQQRCIRGFGRRRSRPGSREFWWRFRRACST